MSSESTCAPRTDTTAQGRVTRHFGAPLIRANVAVGDGAPGAQTTRTPLLRSTAAAGTPAAGRGPGGCARAPTPPSWHSPPPARRGAPSLNRARTKTYRHGGHLDMLTLETLQARWESRTRRRAWKASHMRSRIPSATVTDEMCSGSAPSGPSTAGATLLGHGRVRSVAGLARALSRPAHGAGPPHCALAPVRRPGLRHAVAEGHKRLDVQDGGAVHQVQPLEQDGPPDQVNGHYLPQGKADGHLRLRRRGRVGKQDGRLAAAASSTRCCDVSATPRAHRPVGRARGEDPHLLPVEPRDAHPALDLWSVPEARAQQRSSGFERRIFICLAAQATTPCPGRAGGWAPCR